ncbi:MAG: GyrI-like domain-containing protein [Ignavibacteriales bacterium]|nr:GyrI-like domain-containing protein [Ignavibacteriales bacterium]
MMKKIDLKKDLKYLYQPSASEVELVRVPKFNYLMIDGEGDPNNSQSFQEAVQALYTVAYTLKFMIKKEKSVDYPVMALDGLWWMDDMSQFSMENRGAWRWTLMILQPAVVTKSAFVKALKQAKEKKGFAALSKIRLEPYTEGLSVQIMHVGPYAEEAPTIQNLHAAARERGCELRGKHHEIYLGDPRKSKPEKLKTVIRQPIEKVRSVQ